MRSFGASNLGARVDLPSELSVAISDGLDVTLFEFDVPALTGRAAPSPPQLERPAQAPAGGAECPKLSVGRKLDFSSIPEPALDLDAEVWLWVDGELIACHDECLAKNGAEFWWHSDIDGELARTAFASVGAGPTRRLTPGPHTLTATLKHNDRWQTATIAVRIPDRDDE